MGCLCSTSSARVSSVKGNARSFPDYAETFDGPVRERQCTDVFFLILLAAYICFLVVAVIFAGAKGDPRRLIYGYDEYGNLCGLKNSRIAGANRSGIDFRNMKFLKISQTCEGGRCSVQKECQKECPQGYEKTTMRRCLPSKISQSATQVFQSTLPFLEEIGSDISLCWKEILLLCLISIGLSVALLIVFRFCAAIIIWAVLGIVMVASVAITVYIWLTWNQKKRDLAAQHYEGPSMDLRAKRVTYWLVAAILVTIFTVVFLLVVICMRNKIKLVAALFEEAGKSISAMPLILLQPVLTFLCEAAACCLLLMGFVCLQSSGEAVVDSRGKVTFPINTFFQVTRWLSLFGFLWMTQYILACQHLVVAGAVSTWYFTRDKRRLSSPIWHSLSRLVQYHMGSAAFGSLLIALVKAIRALFRLLQKYLDDQNQKCDIFWKMFQCCLACFESCLKFMTRNAYIMIAIYGNSFCASARRAFTSLASNALRLAAVDCIGDFILFVGKVGVTIAVGFIALEIIKNVDGVHYIWVPVAVSCIFSYLCCHCFLSIYEMAIDTLLLCFCEDCDMNDGITRPFFMNRSLMVFVESSRKDSKVIPLARKPSKY